MKSTYVYDVYLQVDSGCERVVTREGACVCEREGGTYQYNACVRKSYLTNVRHKPFPDERHKNR